MNTQLHQHAAVEVFNKRLPKNILNDRFNQSEISDLLMFKTIITGVTASSSWQSAACSLSPKCLLQIQDNPL